MNVSFGSNHLYIDGRMLTLETSPEELRTILQLGRAAILEGIEEFYETTKRRNPDAIVVRPSIFLLRLGTNSQSKSILTEKGRYNKHSTITDREELKPKYHPYWDAIADSDFTPEVRGNFSGPVLGGIWLMLRKLEIAQSEISANYDPSQYPDKVTCEVMPGLDDDFVVVTVFGTDADVTIVNVPKQAVQLLPRPRIAHEMLESDPVFHEMHHALLGLGLLACRVIDTDANNAVIKVPAVEFTVELAVPLNQIPRKR